MNYGRCNKFSTVLELFITLQVEQCRECFKFDIEALILIRKLATIKFGKIAKKGCGEIVIADFLLGMHLHDVSILYNTFCLTLLKSAQWKCTK